MTRGAFVLIEGLDRAGKSTQCEQLVQQLEKDGRPTKLLKFPNRETAIGKMINEYLTSSSTLSDEAIHLLFSANRWEQSQEIIDLLNQGTTIVVDRYCYSGIAFSAAKNKPGMDVAWCKHPDIGLPKPDLTIFLDVSEHVATERGGYGQERYEKQEFQKKVRQVFMELRQDDWCMISADGSADEVFDSIWTAVQSCQPKDIEFIR